MNPRICPRLLCVVLGLALAAPAPAEVFEMVVGPDKSGDVVWVSATALALMEAGSDQVSSISLGALAPSSRYRALLHRRALTGEPDALALARKTREWGLYDASRTELGRAARLDGLESQIAAEARMLFAAEAGRDMAAARAALARRHFATAGRILQRLAATDLPLAAEAQNLISVNRVDIDQAIARAETQAATRRAEAKRKRAEREAIRGLQEASQLVQEANQIRFDVASESWPISRARFSLIDAAHIYVAASNLAGAALAKAPAGTQLAADLEVVLAEANARLVDCYCDLADVYLVRSNLIEAYDWSSVALAIDPQHERALNIQKATRLGGAIRGGSGGFGRFGRFRGYGGYGGLGHDGAIDGRVEVPGSLTGYDPQPSAFGTDWAPPPDANDPPVLQGE